MFKNKKVKALAVVASTTVGTAQAALPSDAQAAVDSISTFANDMVAAAWPIAGAIVVASVGIKLFKKFANKAS